MTEKMKDTHENYHYISLYNTSYIYYHLSAYVQI